MIETKTVKTKTIKIKKLKKCFRNEDYDVNTYLDKALWGEDQPS